MTSSTSTSSGRVAVVLGTFPKASERFIAREMKSLMDAGISWVLYRHEPGDPPPPWIEWPCEVITIPRGSRLWMGALTGWGSGAWGRTLWALCLAWLRRPSPLDLIRLFRASVRGGWLAASFRNREIGHVHAHFANYPSSSAWVACLLSGTSFSLAGHAWDIFVGPEFLRAKLEFCQKAIACSRRGYEALSSFRKSSDKVALVHHGLPLEEWRRRPAEPSGPFRILWVGRFVEKKRPILFVEALSVLSKNAGLPAWLGVMVGDGPLLEDTRARADRLGLGDRVTFLGECTESEVREQFHAAGLLVLCSGAAPDGDQEGLPNVLLEAGACGVPVVCCDTGSVSELVKDQETGLWAQGSPDSLASRIQSLMTDAGMRRRLADKLHAEVSGSYSSAGNISLLCEELGLQRQPERSLRVLEVLEATEGGTAQYVDSLLPRLQARGAETTLVYSLQRTPMFAEVLGRLKASGVECLEIPMARGLDLLGDLRALMGMCSILGRRSFDVIHAHSSKAGLVARAAAALQGCAHVHYSPHAYAFLGASSGWEERLFLFVERCLASWCDRIVAVSEAEASLTVRKRIAGAGKVTWVRNGIDLDWPWRSLDRREALTRMGFDPSRPSVGAVGRLCRQKNPMDFAEVASQVCRLKPEVQFIWIGEGPEEDRMRTFIRQEKLSQNLFLLGQIQDVRSLYPGLDLLCLTSLWEGMPYVILESMASGVPVVSYHVQGLEEVIESGVDGMLVPVSDKKALCEVICHWISDPSLREGIAINALERARRSFSLDFQADSMLRVYRESLREGFGPG